MGLKLKLAALLGVLLVVGGVAGAIVARSKLPSTPQLKGHTSQSQISIMRQPADSTRKVASLTLGEFQVGKNGRPLIVAGTVNGAAGRFLIDTGCARSGLDE